MDDPLCSVDVTVVKNYEMVTTSDSDIDTMPLFGM